jgi:hypothetical protein
LQDKVSDMLDRARVDHLKVSLFKKRRSWMHLHLLQNLPQKKPLKQTQQKWQQLLLR